jgi:hypothetical protein
MPDQPGRVYRSPIRFRVVAGVPVAVLVLAGCSDGDSSDAAGSDPAAVLAAYQEARNSGDMDARMALYADDAVITGYPSDSASVGESEPVATTDEIRQYESERPSFQRPEDATELFNIQVSGNRVSFDQRFFNDEGDCFGDSGNELTIEDGRITLYDWGPLMTATKTQHRRRDAPRNGESTISDGSMKVWRLLQNACGLNGSAGANPERDRDPVGRVRPRALGDRDPHTRSGIGRVSCGRNLRRD